MVRRFLKGLLAKRCITTFIFDRKQLEQVYTLQPYSDLDVEWEREVRAHEMINLQLALGCLPITDFGMNLDHWGQSTSVLGRKKIVEWETNYLEKGRLWQEKPNFFGKQPIF